MFTIARKNSRVNGPDQPSGNKDSPRSESIGASVCVSGSILLLNFDPPHKEGLAHLLRLLGFKIFVPEEHGISLLELRDEDLRQADLILFDLTRLTHDDVWLPLRRICRLRKPSGTPLSVTCSSRIYRGPDFHLLVEKLGARLVYYGE